MEFTASIPATWTSCSHCANGGAADKSGHAGMPLWCPRMQMVVGHIMKVNPHSDEFLDVGGPIFDLGFEIPLILRVQHPGARERFEAAVAEDDMLPWDCEQKQTLYHVTRARSVTNVSNLIRNGLDVRFSRCGSFGRGIYFASDPAKAHQYRNPEHPQHLMLQARVRLGAVKTFPDGEYDASLVREPDGYDSSKGNMTGHDEYTVYDNQRVLIEYMIFYSDAKTLLDRDEMA